MSISELLLKLLIEVERLMRDDTATDAALRLVRSIGSAMHEPDPGQALRDLLATVGTHDHVAETAEAIEEAARRAADAAPDSSDDGG